MGCTNELFIIKMKFKWFLEIKYFSFNYQGQIIVCNLIFSLGYPFYQISGDFHDIIDPDHFSIVRCFVVSNCGSSNNELVD